MVIRRLYLHAASVHDTKIDSHSTRLMRNLCTEYPTKYCYSRCHRRRTSYALSNIRWFREPNNEPKMYCSLLTGVPTPAY